MEEFKMRVVTRAMRVLGILSLFVIAVYGQTTTGTISGTVADPGGAVVPGASVHVTEEAKKFTLEAITDETGRFVFAQVPPGTYTITVEIPGFKRFERRNVAFSANDRLTLGTLNIEVGQLSDSVEVTAEAVTLKTESAERSD